MKSEFEQKKGEEIELKTSLGKAEATLGAATSLLDKLSGEKERWQNQVGRYCQTCMMWQHACSKMHADPAGQALRRDGRLETVGSLRGHCGDTRNTAGTLETVGSGSGQACLMLASCMQLPVCMLSC